MADVQVENGYIRIATELMDEIIRRDFSKRQLAILHLIIRLSYGCQRKDCLIGKFNFFELAGLNKSDIKKELQFLRECRVLNWSEETMLFSVNKDYEKWQINPSKGYQKQKLDELVHENLRKKVGKTPTTEHGKVGELPTSQKSEVGKIPTKSAIKVGKTPTYKLVKHQLRGASMSCESKDEGTPKDSIKDISLKILKDTTTTTDNPVALFEKLLCRLSPNQSEAIYMWVDDFEGKQEIINEAITIADNKNKRYFGFVEFLLKEWHNNNLTSLDRVRAYEQEKFNKFNKKPRRGVVPVRQEKLPDWFDDEEKPSNVTSLPTGDKSLEEKKRALQEKLKKYKLQG